MTARLATALMNLRAARQCAWWAHYRGEPIVTVRKADMAVQLAELTLILEESESTETRQ